MISKAICREMVLKLAKMYHNPIFSPQILYYTPQSISNQIKIPVKLGAPLSSQMDKENWNHYNPLNVNYNRMKFLDREIRKLSNPNNSLQSVNS